ncbi:MAG: enoyl-CoA hydratase-related protein [Rhodobacteraceae bacterium]|jgi:3-hydroxyacyl-CoA dehydrogenase|nr:enoyl-CoA hydratase-related protein [Paracoccaceae bacterium]
MAELIVRTTRGQVALLTLSAPPSNTLTSAVRAALIAMIDAAGRDPAVSAVVIAAGPPGFPAGADLAEFDLPAEPSLADLCSAVEQCPKPVVAALQGSALGAGFDLALACHWRVADPQARVGFPEIGLGVVPQGGGTQRLPRLAGAGPALDLLLGGAAMGAPAAQRLGIVDGLGPDGPAFPGYATAFAERLVTTGARVRQTSRRHEGLADGRAYMAEIVARRRALRGEPVLAATRIVDCVEAALLMPFDQGLEAERAAFDDCAASPESRALRHVVLAERRAARTLAAAAARNPAPTRVAITGGGEEVAQLAMTCLEAGLDVTIVQDDLPGLEARVAQVDRLCEAAIAAGRLTPTTRDAWLDRLSGAVDPAALAEEALVLAALSATLDDAAAVAAVARVADATGSGTTVGVVSRWHDLSALAPTPHAQRVGVFQPAGPGLRLAELGAGTRTGAATVGMLAALARRLGLHGIGCVAEPGLVLGRMRAVLHAVTDRLLEEGATPAGIDAALQAHGFAAGPYRLRDAEGLDPAAARLRRRGAEARGLPGSALESYLVELGWLGRVAGRGWYRYANGPGETADDPDLLAVLADERRELGLTARRIAPQEIVARCLDALANEGARLVRARGVRVPSDIDMAMIHGAVFPRWRGGPMFAADAGGIPALERRLVHWAEGRDAAFWAPDPLITDLRKNGRDFATLNGD